MLVCLIASFTRALASALVIDATYLYQFWQQDLSGFAVTLLTITMALSFIAVVVMTLVCSAGLFVEFIWTRLSSTGRGPLSDGTAPAAKHR